MSFVDHRRCSMRRRCMLLLLPHFTAATLRPLKHLIEHNIFKRIIIMSDDATSSIPVMRKPVDLLSNGLNSNNLASAAVQRHPIDRMQRGEFTREW
jgi:hypothetical protein